MSTKFLTRDDWRAADNPSPIDGGMGKYAPKWWSIHYGGGGPYRTLTHAEMVSLYRRWRAEHMSGNRVAPMRDIAYNYGACADDDPNSVAYRLRGENPNGAQSQSFLWGATTRTFVMPTGPYDFPSDTQLRSFALMWAQDPLPVRYHSDFPFQNTKCPGVGLIEWVNDEGWLDYLEAPVITLVDDDRYGTAGKVNAFAWQPGDVALVSGRNEHLADALAVAPHASAVVLTNTDALSPFAVAPLLAATRVVAVGAICKAKKVMSEVTALINR